MKYLLLSLTAVFWAGLSPAQADEPAIIAKARAYLGSDAALDAVSSVHLSGTVSGENPSNVISKSWTASVEIIFQKPWQESLMIRYPTQIVHTALDDFEAWQHIQEHTNPGQTVIDVTRASNLIVFNALQVKNLRADTWNNLYFYRGIERVGGTITDEGPATIDGVACEKIVFYHSPAIIYTRYFDLATGRLVFTQTRAGTRIRESGEIMAGGIRFPRTIMSSETSSKGGVISSTYHFDKVVLNESFPESSFSVPLLPISNDTEPLFSPAPGH